MKILLKFFYLTAVVCIFIMGFDVDIDTENKKYEHVGYHLNNDYKSEDINIEYEYLEIEFFYQDVYFESPKIFAEQYAGDVLLNEIYYWDVSDIVENSTNVYKSDEKYRKFYFKGTFIIILYVLFLILIPILVFIASWKNNRINKKKAIGENIDAFYKKCISLKIHSIDTKEDKEKLLLVAKNFGYTTMAQAISCYEAGAKRRREHIEEQELLKAKEQEKQELKAKQRIEEARNTNYQAYIDEKKLTKITGKNKYISIINDKIAQLQAEYKKIEKIDPYALFMKHKKDDWGWIGGIADGIAGPGAGVMAAAEAHERNVNYNNTVDQYNKNLMQSGYNPIKLEAVKREKLETIKKQINDLESYIAVINTAIVNEDTVESDFKKLKFTVNGTILEESLYLYLHIVVKVTQPITLLDRKAIIDGSVLITVLDEKNQKVGDAYYNASDMETYKLKDAGFNNSNEGWVIAVPSNGEYFNKNEKYHYEITPISIWTIEVDS